MWFKTLMGFPEEDPDKVRSLCWVEDGVLTSRINAKKYRVGEFEVASLSELRRRIGGLVLPGDLKVSSVVANVKSLHQLTENAGALFQVASQFNLLEMVNPSVTPERGVGTYEYDGTQGPACAIACGAGTIYRNYFVPVGQKIGQSEDQQIDCLGDVGLELGNTDGCLWKMRNGYALASEEGLAQINARLASATERELDQVREKLKVGVHWRTQVTINECDHDVAQVYGSALPVAYSHISSKLWAPMARLLLEASYEATLLAGLINAQACGNNRIYLTLLGGGAFGNQESWILDAIRRAIRLVETQGLDIRIVSYGSPHPGVVRLVEELA